MSARSARRARERRMRREHGRVSRRAGKLGLGAGGALAAALVVAPGTAGAATFTVTKTADTNGTPCVAADPDCSLREAIEAANANGVADAINFAGGVTGTIALDASFGDMDIRNESLDIQGPGAGQLTINGGGHDRIFKLFGFDAPDQQVVISGLTMTNGLAGDQIDAGGAIFSSDFGDDDFGFPADLTVADSVISNSVAGTGGGIASFTVEHSSAGAMTIRNTTIDNNDALLGGGVFAGRVGEDVTVTASTFSNNNAVFPTPVRAAGTLGDGDGGGLAVDRGPGAVLVQNSTFARNHADGAGGAIRFVSDQVTPPNPRTVRNTTVADNSAGEGGGISVSRFEQSQVSRGSSVQPVVQLSSTIVADNTASALGGDADGPDLRSDNASFNAGFSLLEVTTGATVTDAPPGSNITGQDPQLGGLAGNGGPTQTKLPAAASAAIDAGVGNGLAAEQRGTARTVDRPPANANDGTDIGAVELPLDALGPYGELPGPKETRCLGETLLVKRGGEKGERLEGTPQRDGIFAHGGRDTVLGLEDDDCLFGGVDEDKVKGGPDDDHVAGDPADDSVHGNGGRDDVRGQHGDDKVFGGAGGDKRVTGGIGDDRVFGGPGDDNLIKGDGGNDYLDLGSGNDFVHAGGGKDEIHAADGDVDEIVCGTGHDVAFVDPGDTVLPDCNTVHVVG